MVDPFSARLQRLTDLDAADIAALGEAFGATRAFEARRSAPLHRENRLHVIVSGWAARFKGLRDGRRQIVAMHLPGDVFELDALMLSRAPTSLETFTPCVFGVAERSDLQALMGDRPAIGRAMWRLTCIENDIAAEQAMSLGRRSAYERIGHFFCELRLRLAAIGAADEAGLPLPLTQADLGDALGLSVVHVNRVLQAMRRDNLLAVEGRRVSIPDLERLERVSHFDGEYLHLAPRTSHGETSPILADARV